VEPWLDRVGPRSVVVFTVALASSIFAAPYALAVSITREAMNDLDDQRMLVGVVVTAVTAVLTGMLGWIVTSPRSTKRAMWLCALAPAFGLLDPGLSFGTVNALTTHEGFGDAIVHFFAAVAAGVLFGGFVFGVPMGILFGLALVWLVHRAVSVRALAARDTLEQTVRWAGAWLFLCAAVAAPLLVLAGHQEIACAVPAFVCGWLFIVAANLRRRSRERWLVRVGAGQVPGWRIASLTALPAALTLPLLDAGQKDCDGVLTRVLEQGSTYREAAEQEEPYARVRRP
jgi:hypothetical protein